MAHWAEIDFNNFVVRVLVTDNNADEGKLFVNSLGGVWVQTSYNANIRKNFAGIGYTYDIDREAFIAPRNNCHAEEILDEATCRWTCDNVEHLTEILTN